MSRSLLLPLLLLLSLSSFFLISNKQISIYLSDDHSSSAVGGDTNSLIYGDDEADFIIQRSFRQTYAHILPCDDILSSKKSDGKIHVAKECMLRTRDYVTSENITVPWWFQTLLRDITGRGVGVFASWHHFYTTKPPLNFCTMDKVATTEWRKVFCKLNAEDCINNLCGKRNCSWHTKQTMPIDAPWAVFIRDPLERLLSGYLDKCSNPIMRKMEGHCEPNVVFNPMGGLQNAKNNPYPNLLDSIEDNDKVMFGAYVDVLPLKWNSHFVPQALHCDLYRNINMYHFVGNMGRDFYFELERMANQFGGQLPEILNTTFGYIEHVKNDNHENTGQQGNKHATHAAEKVSRFYTARTVRKALEYLSIDYVTMGIEVPEWARQMLRDEKLKKIT